MYFDAHSDIWADVTLHRMAGETNVFDRLHAPRLKKGNVEGAIIVMWVDPPHDRHPVLRTEQIFQCVGAELQEAQSLRVITCYDDIAKAKAEGHIYVLVGVEGMAYIRDDISRLDDYCALGARHGMLTWNESNSLGSGALSGCSDGLTDLGKQMVRRMQERNMIVDTSHLNEAGFWDIVKLSQKPIIASHSNCKALCGHPRNLTDDQLRAIRDLNGVVGLNSWRNFVNSDLSVADVDHLALHADRMLNIMGIDHVGGGYDFFEFLGTPEDPEAFSGEDSGCPGLEDCTKIDGLFAIFEKMGLSREEREKIAYGNFHRVIRECLG